MALAFNTPVRRGVGGSAFGSQGFAQSARVAASRPAAASGAKWRILSGGAFDPASWLAMRAATDPWGVASEPTASPTEAAYPGAPAVSRPVAQTLTGRLLASADAAPSPTAMARSA